jgi:hypothetical protein
MTQCVRSDPLGDLRGLCRLDDDAMELPGADRLHGVLSWKQPPVAMHHALLVADLPPLAQQGEQIYREHGIAIPASAPNHERGASQATDVRSERKQLLDQHQECEASEPCVVRSSSPDLMLDKSLDPEDQRLRLDLIERALRSSSSMSTIQGASRVKRYEGGVWKGARRSVAARLAHCLGSRRRSAS